MKVHEFLKQGIEEQDWLKVCAAYTAITGKKISPPKKKVSLIDLDIPEELLEEIEATRNDDDDYEDEEEYDDVPDPSKIGMTQEEDEEDEEEVPLLEETPPEPEIAFPVSKKKGGESEFSISHGVQGPKASSDGNGTIMTKVPIAQEPRKNKFKDNLAVKAGDLKKNNPILKKIYGKGSTRATRDLIDAPDTGKLYAVECSLCKKSSKVTAALARGYNKNPENNTYRCTECDTPSGRAKLARRERDLGVYDG